MKSFLPACLASAAALAVLAMPSPAAYADRISEVESARANARAGGPISEHDRELLDRWGALSGTPYIHSWRGYVVEPRVRVRRKRR